MNIIVGVLLNVAILAVAAGSIFIGVKKHKLKNDSDIEELVEKKIEEKTGIKVDLSPDTPDPDDEK